VQHIPLSARAVLSAGDRQQSPQVAFTLITSRMKTVGQSPEATAKGGGNPTKKLRFDLLTDLPEREIAKVLGGIPANKDLRSADRLPAEELERVTAEHVWNAVQLLLAGYDDHGLGQSTDFDLLADRGIRLPPKAVFGLAASEALGFSVKPRHFSAGKDSPCFRILERSGYTIVPKGESAAVEEMPTTPEDLEWSEGRPKLVAHLRRERARGLSQAKKAAFKREHGRLFCERCHIDPVGTFGPEAGEACIEVHHEATQVKDMEDRHVTKLDDLKCLCANCHRIVHHLTKFNLTSIQAP
jgi:5-methylcytosine-specific restriction protein A